MLNKSKLFTIIVTTYNNETSIQSTLDSIIHQTLDNSHYEIIVVDDCSTDETWSILQKYKRDNIVLHRLERNTGGPSQPRNVGLQLAQGKYVYFHDGDDWLHSEILNHIYEQKKWHKSDVIVGKVLKFKNGNTSVHAKFMSIKDRINNKPLKIPYLFYYLGPAGKFIKKDLLTKHQITFPDDTHFGEDKIFFMNVFKYAQKVTTTTKEVTFFNRSTDNQSIVRSTDFLEKRRSDFKLFEAVLKAKDRKFKEAFMLRVLEYDLLNNCNSHVFLKLSEKEKQQTFEIIRAVYTHKKVSHKLINKIDTKYSDAVDAIMNDDLEKFVDFFRWYKKEAKVYRIDKKHVLTQTDYDDKFHVNVPYANLLNLQVTKNRVVLQLNIFNVPEEDIKGLVLESRNQYDASVDIDDFVYSNGVITIDQPKSMFTNLKKGLYNVFVVYDEYKAINIKYGFTKEIGNLTFYPTIHGNLSIKKVQ
ncbi:glycosyltransferase family 2 protein [Staphylococcus hyicus]|uniref:glycosyltransferase family 2 protein n=1 Tax=Staphylococcus hyicus TaxID=1284 RepID=UPI00057C519A|nr:glycosyltransferase family 2 protein [Staphylococcus hyicus]AJC95174.1 glycosyltransferase [Staphylococcus hyicus]RTX69718.1 glycosyltransferase family 2 protein [Staphylococcus hyicus]SQE46670.1 glycosyltransferase [Staphylococcus hyicus]